MHIITCHLYDISVHFVVRLPCAVTVESLEIEVLSIMDKPLTNSMSYGSSSSTLFNIQWPGLVVEMKIIITKLSIIVGNC